MQDKRKKCTMFTLFAGVFLFTGVFAHAQSNVTFIIDKGYDAKDREAVEAQLEHASPHAFFFLEKEYLESQSSDEKVKIQVAVRNLANEFEEVIYPQLTSFLGGIGVGPDGDSATTVLFHEMEDISGGYFNPGNLYSRAEQPGSNERNLIHLNIRKIRQPVMKSLLAHEFEHVISFYQKDKKLRQSEDVWLNELRAEYAPTYLGYDDAYRRSNLEQRVVAFVESPSDSLTEWRGGRHDYGVVGVFGQYLVGRFGHDLLKKSIQSAVTGIESIEATLQKLGHTKSFSDVFRDWVVASFLNDCSVLPQDTYCYKNPNLTPRTLKIQLSRIGEGEKVQIFPATKAWQGNWYEFTTTELKPQKLKFSFSSTDPKASFRIPYVLKRRGKPLEVHEFSVVNQKVEAQFENFGSDIFGFAPMPFHQGKRRDFTNNDPFVLFSLQVSIVKESVGEGLKEEVVLGEAVEIKEQNSSLKDSLFAQPALTKKETEKIEFVAKLQEQIIELEQQLLLLLEQKKEEAQKGFSYEWNKDLYFGLRSSKDVEALQLALQDQRVYNGPVTGNFFDLTFRGVKNFQEKHGIPQVGRVGPQTRAKLNELYAK